MGAEYYVHFGVKSDALQGSSQMDALLEDQGGVSEVTDEGDVVVVARLDAESNVKVGEPTEVWLDATKMHFFDAESGEALNH
jgi:multiple sugar transport system ATP-binding protein